MFFSKFSPKVLVGVTCTFCTVTCGSIYLRKSLEDKLYDMKLCRNSLELFMHDKNALDVIGFPMSSRRPKLSDTFNKITETTAEIAIPVSGTKTFGNLLIVAFKGPSDSAWTLKSLNLKIDDKILPIFELSS